MTKDKALQELFCANKPEFNDKDAFMLKLERKLEAVEYIKEYEEANLRRYKYAVVIAFVLGLASGGLLLAFMLSAPLDVPLFTFKLSSGVFVFIQQNSRMIATVVLIAIMCFSVVSVANNILDISKMRFYTRVHK